MRSRITGVLLTLVVGWFSVTAGCLLGVIAAALAAFVWPDATPYVFVAVWVSWVLFDWTTARRKSKATVKLTGAASR